MGFHIIQTLLLHRGNAQKEIKQDLSPAGKSQLFIWRVFDVTHISDDNPVASIKAIILATSYDE